jgi:hypothetical protein
MKQVPHWAPTNTGHHDSKFSVPGFVYPCSKAYRPLYEKTGATKCLCSVRKTYDWNSGITYNLDGTFSSDSSHWAVSHVETSCDRILPQAVPFTGCNHVVISHSAPKLNVTNCWRGSGLSLTRNSGSFLSALLGGVNFAPYENEQTNAPSPTHCATV